MYGFERKKKLNFWFVYFRKIVNIENCKINVKQFQKSLDFKILFALEHSTFSSTIYFPLQTHQHVSVKLHCLALTLDCENFRRDWEQLFDECHSENSISRKWLVTLKTTKWKFRVFCPTQKSHCWDGKSYLTLNTQHWVHNEKNTSGRMFAECRRMCIHVLSRNRLTHLDVADYIIFNYGATFTQVVAEHRPAF